MTPILVGSLFSGIGGYELGVLQALRDKGIPCRLEWQVEKDEYCRKVLAKHWPKATRYDDVNTFLKENPQPVDVLLGGFPCQDISIAGAKEGINGKRSGLFYSLWRAARALECRYVLMENVSNVSLWGGAVLGEITRSGYDAEWSLISAKSVGAPHLRRRWWAVCELAHASSKRLQGTQFKSWDNPKGWEKPNGRVTQRGQMDRPRARGLIKPRLGGVSNGVSPRLDRHQWPRGRGVTQEAWEPPRVAPRQPYYTQRIKALGNSIVPQCAYIVGVRLAEKIQSERR